MPSDTTAVPQQLGNYEIVSKIADGGMGTVYKAQHRTTGAIVAVKVIAAVTAKNPILLQRFEREFVAAKVLDHPNVVRALEYCGSGPQAFLVMEYVDGESIGQRLERTGAMSETEAVRLVAQVCEGLQRAHKQGLVHRDVKPDNILITRDGVAKLTDMGLVKDIEGDLNLTKTGRGLGTPHYMAPEQFRNAKGVDVRCDIYSLGATLYAMVTGLVPFDNANPLDCWMKKIHNEFSAPKAIRPGVSDRVDWAIRRAMSAEPDRRPASCREFLEDLTGQSRATPIRSGLAAGRMTTPEREDLWYVIYKDEVGEAHTGKGNTERVRNAIRDLRLGDPATILISRTKIGQFSPVTSVPEFRDLVVNPAPLTATGGTQRNAGGSGMLAKASGVVPGSGAQHRRPADPDAVDLGAPPAGGVSVSQSGWAVRSGNHAVAGYATPRPDAPADDTLAYTPPHGTPPPPELRSRIPRQSTPATETAFTPVPAARAPFDWTPILAVAVMLMTTAIGYLLLAK